MLLIEWFYKNIHLFVKKDKVNHLFEEFGHPTFFIKLGDEAEADVIVTVVGVVVVPISNTAIVIVVVPRTTTQHTAAEIDLPYICGFVCGKGDALCPTKPIIPKKNRALRANQKPNIPKLSLTGKLKSKKSLKKHGFAVLKV